MKQHGRLPTPYDGYDIHGLRHFETGPERYCERHDNADAEFWRLYGYIPGLGLECIGDFKHREDAETMYARITGRSFRNLQATTTVVRFQPPNLKE